MKKVLALVFIAIFFGCATAQSQLQHTWEEVDQAVTDVQNAQPIPDGKLVPDGGTTGQVLEKKSDIDGDTGWADPPSGTGAQKWNLPLFIKDAASAPPFIPWIRPFDDWKLGGVTGRVDVGTADVDLIACDADGANCLSFLSGVFTLTTTEQAIPLAFNGIMANTRLEVTLSNISSATEVWLDSHGTYETGTPPSSSQDYLFEMDFETDPGMDVITGNPVCPPAADGDYCLQDTTNPHGGTYCLTAKGGETSVQLNKTFTATSDFTVDFWWRWETAQSGGTPITFYDDTDTQVGNLYLYKPGTRVDLTVGNTSKTYSSYDPTEGVWYHYRVRLKPATSAGADGIIQFWYSDTITDFDGVSPNVEWTNLSTDIVQISKMQFRAFAAGDIGYDDAYAWETE